MRKICGILLGLPISSKNSLDGGGAGMPTLPSALREAILQSVDAAFEAQLQFTEALVRFPSTRGKEGTCQDFLLEAYRARLRSGH
jgi:hypothetical protein